MADPRNGGAFEAKQPTTTYLESAPYQQQRPSCGRRFLNHYKKYWWAHLLNTCVVTIVSTMILTYVAFPAIAQAGVDKSTLNLTEMILNSPTPNSVVVSQKGILHNYTPFVPHLDAMNVSLFLEDTEPNIKPFAQIEMAAVKSGKQTPVSIQNQTMRIIDMEQFIRYSGLTMAAKQFRLALRGKTKLKQGALHTMVNYNEVLTLKGLNNLDGFQMKGFKILALPNCDGANMVGWVEIPNPTIMTIEMGNVTQQLSIDGTPVGTALMPNLTLKPGNHTYKMYSNTNQTLVLDFLEKKYSKCCQNQVPVDAVGNSSIYNGQHIHYYEVPLQSQKLRTTLTLTEDVITGTPWGEGDYDSTTDVACGTTSS
jgi:hypothetical protein